MEPNAPAQEPTDIEVIVGKGIEEIRAEGPRPVGKRLDLSDPRQINKEVVVALARKISPDTIASKIDSLINTTRTLKSGEEVPDVRAMEAGIKLYLAYAVGLPTQRSEVISVNLDADSAVGLRERLKSSPALRNALRGMLSEIED